MKSGLFVGCMVATVLTLPFAGAATSPGADEPTSVINFYGHIFGLGRGSPMPMNTQFPYGEADLSQGLVGQNCGMTPTDTCEDSQTNEEWFYTTAGFVQVKNQNDFSYGKLHNERGLTKDTLLDKTQDITASFYMSADAHGWPLAACTPPVPNDVPWPVPCWNWDPGMLQQWQVQATIYTGVLGAYGGAADSQPDMVDAVASGKLNKLADGVSAPVDVKSLEATGSPTVWKFDVNLGKAARDTIKKEESYVVRFKWWSLKPDGSHRIVPEVDVWNVDGGEYYPPVVRLPVKSAFNVELVVPQFVYGKLVVLGVMNTPWGSYDVNQDSIKLTIKDNAGQPLDPKHLTRLADFSVAHGAHYKPVNVTYVWDYRADKLAPGDYSATVGATNYQGSAASECTARFTILRDGSQGGIKVGECGVRTISDTQLQTIQDGSKSDAGGKAKTVAPLLPVALGLVVLSRRWRK